MASTTFCPSCGAEYLAGVVECADCHVVLGQAPTVVGESQPQTQPESQPQTQSQPQPQSQPAAAEAELEGDEVVYDLGDWSNDDRGQLELLLTGGGLTHRWEVGTDLVIMEADADRVELLLDEVEAAGAVPPLPATEDDADDGGDEATYAVMSDLFVAADRLQKDPSDAAIAGDFYVAADAAAVTPAPFGIDRLEWQQVQELAASLAAAMETDADDDVIARDASALRGLLARYV